MQEKTIYKISIVAIILGLLFLFFYSEELELKAVEAIDTIMPEKEIKVKGTIDRITVTEKATFLNLVNDETEIDVILFTTENIYLAEGDYVELSGTVEEYMGKKEIIANKIVKK